MAGAAISDLNIQLRQTELRAYDRQILGDTQLHSISSIDDLQTIAVYEYEFRVPITDIGNHIILHYCRVRKETLHRLEVVVT